VIAKPARKPKPKAQAQAQADFRAAAEQETAAKAQAPARADLIACPADVPAGVFADFLMVRKARRAPLTATALAGIGREAAKVGEKPCRFSGMTRRPGLDVKFHGARGSQVFVEERQRPSQDGSPVWALRLLKGTKRADIIEPNPG